MSYIMSRAASGADVWSKLSAALNVAYCVSRTSYAHSKVQLNVTYHAYASECKKSVTSLVLAKAPEQQESKTDGE